MRPIAPLTDRYPENSPILRIATVQLRSGSGVGSDNGTQSHESVLFHMFCKCAVMFSGPIHHNSTGSGTETPEWIGNGFKELADIGIQKDRGQATTWLPLHPGALSPTRLESVLISTLHIRFGHGRTMLPCQKHTS